MNPIECVCGESFFEEISISIFASALEKGSAWNAPKKQRQKHFESHFCTNDTRERDKNCAFGFSFSKGV